MELLSAAIIYAGIEAEDNMMILIGAAMFLVGFAILNLRGKLKKNEIEAEEMALLEKFEAFIDWLPDGVKEEGGKKVFELLGFETKDLPEGETTTTGANTR